MQYQIPIIIVLIVIIIGIFIYRKRSKKGEKAKGKRKKKGKEKSSNRKKGRGRQERASDPDEYIESDDSESSESGEEQDDLKADAYELYDLVHEEMVNGIELEEFEDIVGGLAGDQPSFIYIELGQMYEQARDKNMDPGRSITKEDYVKVLKAVD